MVEAGEQWKKAAGQGNELEDEQNILYTCVKCYNKTHYFLQLTNTN